VPSQREAKALASFSPSPVPPGHTCRWVFGWLADALRLALALPAVLLLAQSQVGTPPALYLYLSFSLSLS